VDDEVRPADLVEDREEDARAREVDDQPLDGFERIYIYDPFGNRLELMQPRG
jgi:hypothetical protein